MVKNVTAFALLSLLLTGCANSDTVEIPSAAEIGFDYVFVGADKQPVRGMVNNDNLEKFFVFGGLQDAASASVFDNVAVSRQNGGAWTPASVAYWEPETSYTFMAYAGESARSLAAATPNGVELTGYTVKNAALAEQEDLLIAVPVAMTTGEDITEEKPVKLTFRHALSSVKFAFSSSFNERVTLSISDLTIKNVAYKGDYKHDGKAFVWTPTADRADFTVGSTELIDGSATCETPEMLLLPQTAESLTVTFKLSATGVLDIKDRVITATLPAVTFEEGRRYTFQAQVALANIDPADTYKPLEFKASSCHWEAYGK